LQKLDHIPPLQEKEATALLKQRETDEPESDVPRYQGYSAEELVAQTGPGLSYYLMVAPARAKKGDDDGDNELISIKTFKDLFCCSICFGVMKDPVAIRSCLHKFCQNCLEELHRTSKQCP